MQEQSRRRARNAAGPGQETARRISREEQGHDPRTFLARASRLLADSLDYEKTLRTVAGLALPYLGAWCIVDTVEHEDGKPRLRRLAIVHPEPEKQEITSRLEEGWPPEREDPIGAPVVLRTRKSQVVSRVTDEMLKRAARSEENLRDLRQLGMGSFLVIPLIARERILGSMTFISPTGGEVYTEDHLRLAENLAVVCALAIDNARLYRDTQQARSMAGSEQRGRRYAEAIVDTVRDPLLILDHDLRVQRASRSFYRSFRTSPEETEGRYIYDVGDGQWDSPRLRRLLEEILPENTEFGDFEIEQEFRSIGRRTMLLNARRVHRGREGTELILLAIEDVTDRRRAEEERERLLERERAAKDQAEQAVRAREQVLGIVSHDLRNPLNAISSSARLLQMLPTEERREEEGERLEAIVRSTERMNRLIGDLLDVSRIEAGHFSVEKAPVDVAALLGEACKAFRSRAEVESLELECAATEDVLMVSADRDRILQVLENIVGNAIKFTPEGGRITVQVQAMDTEVHFSVSDTGPGIPEKDLKHLFDPYWRAEGTTEDGAGLGLFISKGIVESHGGRIWPETETRNGTTLHFTIPVGHTES